MHTKYYKAHIKNSLNDLFRFDRQRIYNLLEIIQFSSLYVIFGWIAGVSIDKLFPSPDENKSNTQIFIEIILQCILSALGVYYMRKITKIIPFILEGKFSEQHNIEEYNGEIVVAIIFIGTQKHLIEKIDILHKKIFD